MSSTPKKRALVLSSFSDKGTGEEFTKGQKALLDAGVFDNYKAGGLVKEDPAAKAKPPVKSKAIKKAALSDTVSARVAPLAESAANA